MSDGARPTPPPAERKVACKLCRRRKAKCDRARPKCGICTKGGWACEYAESQRQPPGLRAGYVQSLEQRIDGLEQRLQVLESRGPQQAVGGTLQTPVLQDQAQQGAPRPEIDAFRLAAGGTQDSAYFAELLQSMHASRASNVSQDGLTHAVNGAVTTDGAPLNPLAPPVVQELCEIWFRKYHRWFPILHHVTFMRAVDAMDQDCMLVAKAIVAVTLHHSELLATAIEQQQEQWQNQISSSVILECVDGTSVQSAQALLILSAVHYGKADFMKSWNLLAMARRTSAHIGVTTTRDLNTASSPTALRRLADFTNTTIAQEETVRAYWMGQTLESISTIGAPYELAGSTTPGDPLLPCSDAFWDDPDLLGGEHQMRPYSYCSAFSLCVILAASELSLVHRFLRRPVNMAVFEERDAWQAEAQRLDERLTSWRDEFVAAVFRLINAEYAHRERPEMDAYVVLTNCVLNTAVITLLQRRAASPEESGEVAQPWPYANLRCMYASENTAFKIRQMDEDELLVCHPHLIFSIFVAARFYIVHSKAADANVPTNLHCLAFALHTCGKRWPLARHCERILRTAVAEYRTPLAMTSLPREFYDLRLSTFEVLDTLVSWARSSGAPSDSTMHTDTGHNGSMIFTPMSLNPQM